MSKIIRLWPRSAYVTIVGLIIVFGFVLNWVYAQTKDAYRSVGFNDGQIYQQEQLLKKIQQTVTIENCNIYLATSKSIEFLTIKTDSIFLIVSSDNRAQFCHP